MYRVKNYLLYYFLSCFVIWSDDGLIYTCNRYLNSVKLMNRLLCCFRKDYYKIINYPKSEGFCEKRSIKFPVTETKKFQNIIVQVKLF